MKINAIIDLTGLILTLIGVWLGLKSSPINATVQDGGQDTSLAKEGREANAKNTKIKIGAFLVISGAILQFFSNHLPICE